MKSKALPVLLTLVMALTAYGANSAIGERLAEMRKDHGDPQATLAAQIGVSLPAI